MKKINNNITELVFILDRSGSMAGLESDTIGGFNAMIKKQKKQDGECFVSTVLFDDESTVLHDRVQLCDVPEMTDKDRPRLYCPHRCAGRCDPSHRKHPQICQSRGRSRAHSFRHHH